MSIKTAAEFFGRPAVGTVYSTPNIKRFDVERRLNERGRPLRRPTGDKMTDVPFKVGDRVKKRSGYEYPGFVVSVFTNRAGAVRYVVEADHPAFSGMLHIFNGDQLEHR